MACFVRATEAQWPRFDGSRPVFLSKRWLGHYRDSAVSIIRTLEEHDRCAGYIAARPRFQAQYEITNSQIIATSRSSWTSRSSTISFPLSYEKTMKDYPFLRMGKYPQAGGTRPKEAGDDSAS